MPTKSKPALAVGQKAADNLTSVLAVDLVKEPKFKSLIKCFHNSKTNQDMAI